MMKCIGNTPREYYQSTLHGQRLDKGRWLDIMKNDYEKSKYHFEERKRLKKSGILFSQIKSRWKKSGFLLSLKAL